MLLQDRFRTGSAESRTVARIVASFVKAYPLKRCVLSKIGVRFRCQSNLGRLFFSSSFADFLSRKDVKLELNLISDVVCARGYPLALSAKSNYPVSVYLCSEYTSHSGRWYIASFGRRWYSSIIVPRYCMGRELTDVGGGGG